MSPLDWSAEGPTAEAAVAKLQEEANRHVSNGTRIESIDVPIPEENPWLKLAGTWDPDDPFIEEWIKAIEENRRAADNDPDVF